MEIIFQRVRSLIVELTYRGITETWNNYFSIVVVFTILQNLIDACITNDASSNAINRKLRRTLIYSFYSGNAYIASNINWKMENERGNYT